MIYKVIPFEETYRRCAPAYAGHHEPNLRGSATYLCAPLLHKYVYRPTIWCEMQFDDSCLLCCCFRNLPAAHDFYVSLLPKVAGGLSAGAHKLDPAWAQPLTFDR